MAEINVLQGIYYGDKEGRFIGEDEINSNYPHTNYTLVFGKGDRILDDSEFEDSEYQAILSSPSLEIGIHYTHSK